jgi:hypothetical protein
METIALSIGRANPAVENAPPDVGVRARMQFDGPADAVLNVGSRAAVCDHPRRAIGSAASMRNLASSTSDMSVQDGARSDQMTHSYLSQCLYCASRVAACPSIDCHSDLSFPADSSSV